MQNYMAIWLDIHAHEWMFSAHFLKRKVLSSLMRMFEGRLILQQTQTLSRRPKIEPRSVSCLANKGRKKLLSKPPNFAQKRREGEIASLSPTRFPFLPINLKVHAF